MKKDKIINQIKLQQKSCKKIKIPNATTLKAFRDSELGKNLTYFDSPQELFKALGMEFDK